MGLGSVAACHPKQVGSAIDGVPGERGHVDDPGTLQQGHLGAKRAALSASPNFATFPPPDLGFMITKGCCCGAAACSRGLAGERPLASAVRRAVTAAAESTTLSAISHSSPATTYTTIRNTGAATSAPLSCAMPSLLRLVGLPR
jgi:hypothetical protein